MMPAGFRSVLWFMNIPASEGGLARGFSPIPGNTLAMPIRLTPMMQIYGTGELAIGQSAEVGVTGALPQSGNYQPNPGSPPATNQGSPPSAPSTAASTPGAPRGVSPGVRTAISIGLPIVGRALGVPGLVVSVVGTIINRVIGPSRVAAPIVPGTTNSAAVRAAASGPAAGEPGGAFDPSNPSSYDFVPGVTGPGSFGAYLGSDYGQTQPGSSGGAYFDSEGSQSPGGAAGVPGGEYSAANLEMPSNVETPYGEQPENPISPEHDTPF